VTLFGEYDNYLDTKAAKPKRGHNKDHRPDLKQIVYSLSIASDFAVPLYFKIWDGNTTDDTTHLRNWTALRAVVGTAKFIYIADSKLCVRDTLQYITAEGGSFVTVMPETRSEIDRFQQWIQTNNPDWQKAIEDINPRQKDRPMRTFWTSDSPFLTTEGYRIVWVKSLQKQLDDAQRRFRRIEKTDEILGELQKKNHTNRDKLDAAVRSALQANHTKTYFDYQIVTEIEEITKQQNRGRPDGNTVYRKIEKISYKLVYSQNPHTLQYEARYDGIFPLITNREEPAKEILLMYKYQPNLEKRHEQLKSVYNIAPVFLQNPQRIESLMLLYFLGMLIASLMERDIRKEMGKQKLDGIPIYPENRKCKAPTADRLIELFNDVRLQYICEGKHVRQVIADTLTNRQLVVLDLLKITPAMFFKYG
jgi:transposase